MSLVNTGVNYPVERGGRGVFKALDTFTSVEYVINSSSPLILTPALGNSILLFGLAPKSSVQSNIPSVSVIGGLYGPIISNKELSTQASPSHFYIAPSLASISGGLVNSVPSILFETDESVTISVAGLTNRTVYVSYQEGYVL